MSSAELTKREQHIKSIFLPEQKSEKKEYLPEERVLEIVKDISSIGERYGFVGDKESVNLEKSSKRKHKYDVWIAKEIKKNLNLLNQFSKIRLILDWAIQTKADIFLFSFEEAFQRQEVWHKDLFEKYKIEELNIQEIDNDRVLYRCSDKNHFIYLLNAEDLKYEGKVMSMCVGGENYKADIRNNRSIIISLRDEKNQPHVTTEINIKSGNIIQQYGKGNSTPKAEYKRLMIEFILFATNYENLENGEVARLLNLGQTL
jgi:hypothetical protein